jgi:hypothetical protein
MTMQLVKIDKGDAYIADMFIIAALRLKSLVDGVRSTLGSFTLIFYILYTSEQSFAAEPSTINRTA